MLLWLTVVVAILFRFVGLDHLPGINGDEAYLGAKVALFLRDDSISLKTGTDLFGDPISFAVSCVLHLLFGNSFWILRLTTVITGLSYVGLTYVFVKRFYGGAIASIAVALAACMPTAIAYSRFFWEPSQSPLVATAWLFAAFARRIWLTALLGALAVVVHPTNVFLAPMVLLPYLTHSVRLAEHRQNSAPRGRLGPLTKGLLVAVPLLSVLAVLAHLYHDHSRVLDALRSANERLTNAQALRDFLRHFPGLFTGATVYAYIVRPLNAAAEARFTAAFIALFVVPVAISIILDWRKLGGLVVGLILSLGAFFLIAGPDAISPDSERYALWMLPPHCLVAAIAWHHLGLRLKLQKWLPLSTALVCAMWLGTFQLQYFRQLEQQNSVTESAFATGPREPKLVAFETILQQRRDQRVTRIYAEDWWSYWALKYLALGRTERIEVTILDASWDRRFPVDFLVAPLDKSATREFYVGYTSGAFVGRIAAKKRDFSRFDIRGYGGRRILSVFCAP